MVCILPKSVGSGEMGVELDRDDLELLAQEEYESRNVLSGNESTRLGCGCQSMKPKGTTGSAQRAQDRPESRPTDFFRFRGGKEDHIRSEL